MKPVFHFLPAREALGIYPRGQRLYAELYPWSKGDLDTLTSYEWATLAQLPFSGYVSIVGCQLWNLSKLSGRRVVYSNLIYVNVAWRRHRIAANMRAATERFTEAVCTYASGATWEGQKFNEFMNRRNK